jgi:hypothetical protein
VNGQTIAIIAAVPALYVLLKVRRDSFLGVCLFVLLSSITMTPSLPLVGDRLSIADAVMLPTLFGAFTRGELGRKVPAQLRHTEFFVSSFIGLCTVSSVLAILQTYEPDRLILFLLIYLYGFFCYRLIVRVVDTPRKFAIVCLYWMAGATIVILFGFLASTGIYRPEWSVDPVINRVSSTMKGSGQVSSYIGPAFFILVFLAADPAWRLWKRVLVIGLMGASGVVFLGTGSRISLIILLFSIAYSLAVVVTARGTTVRKGPLLVATVVGITAFSLFAASVWSDTSEEYSLVGTSPFERPLKMFAETSRRADAGIEEWGGTRYDETAAVLEHFTANPILGIGSGMFTSVYYINEVHDTYMSILGENGLLSFFFFWCWWLSVAGHLLSGAIRGRSPDSRYIHRLMLGAFIALSIYQTTTNGLRQRPFWFTPAILLSGAVVLRRAEATAAQTGAGNLAPAGLSAK